MILMAIVALTLLVTCANLAGLLLARATPWQREIMLRLAVGASRGRLVRQPVVEGAVLAGAGAAAGMETLRGGAYEHWWAWSRRVRPRFPWTSHPDVRVLVFTVAVSLVTTFLFALVPALRATRVDVAAGLKENTAATAGSHHPAAGRMLLAIRVAVALVLLAGATLFTRSLSNLRGLPLGFNPRNLTLFDVAPGRNGYDEVRGNQFYVHLRERLREMRGVTAVSLSTERLLSGYVSSGGVLIEGGPKEPAPSNFNFVGPDFFPAVGIPVVLGRGVEEARSDGDAAGGGDQRKAGTRCFWMRIARGPKVPLVI